jgi:hypothetical protein
LSGLPLSAAGYERYRTWRDAPTTAANDIALVDHVLGVIAETGWPPTAGQGGGPRWMYWQDLDPRHWIVAPTPTLWVIVRPDHETCDFVTVHHPTPDDEQRAPWLTDPNDR